MSVREARAQFAAAVAAAERGERITITRNGKPVAEIGPASEPATGGFDWDALDRFRREHGLDKVVLPDDWQEGFDDPALGREIFGPDYFDEKPTGA